MGIVAAPSTCAECRRTEILDLHCKNCRLHFCEECAKHLRYHCPICKGRLEGLGFDLI